MNMIIKKPLLLSAALTLLVALAVVLFKTPSNSELKTGALLNQGLALHDITAKRLVVEDRLLAGEYINSGFNLADMISTLADLEDQETLLETAEVFEENISESNYPAIIENYRKLLLWL